MRENDEFDLLIDSALSDYADPGSQSGLEQRVLARIFAEVVPPRRRWLPWAIAIPAAAGLLLLVLSPQRATRLPPGTALESDRPRTPQIVSTHAGSRPAERTKSPVLKSQPRFATLSTTSVTLPKLDVFPTPQPLTPEEQAVAISAFQIPAAEFQAVVVGQQQEDAPVSIAAINIQPLEPPDNGGN